MKVKVKPLVLDRDIYPRKRGLSQKTIDAYVEALRAGAKFPPIEIQRVKVDGKITNIILDGAHRVEAYKVEKIDEIDAKFWKDKVLDKREDLLGLRIESVCRNREHGDRLSKEDMKEMCRKMAEDDPKINITYEMFAKVFGVVSSTISDWIGDIRARQRGSRNSLIYRLHMLGWQNKKIAEKVGVSETVVGEEIRKCVRTQNLIISEFEKGKSVQQIAEYYGLDLQTTWAFILEGCSDLEIWEKFGEEGNGYRDEFNNKAPKVFNVWNFSTLDDRLGQRAEGNIPGQIVMNILYYFTEKGDLVVDPMAGGGSTVDACLIMGRKCRAFDINTFNKRKDIEEWDIRKGFPNDIKNPKLIFLDPPYYDMVASFGKLFKNLDDFYSFIRKIADDCMNILPKKKGLVALVMGDRTKENYECLTNECYKIFQRSGFRCVQRISAPLTTESADANEMIRARESKKLLGRDRNIYKTFEGEV